MVFNNMSVPLEKDIFLESISNLKDIFKYAEPYQLFQPTYFSGHYSIMFCSNKVNPLNFAINWEAWKKKGIQCKYYNKEIHTSCFSLPNFAIEEIQIKERLGTHFLIDAKDIKFNILDNLNYLFKMCICIINMYKMNILNFNYNKFSPQGVSIFFLLAESHLSLHTWPELGKISIDMFSCKEFLYDVNFPKIGKKINIIHVIKSYLKTSQINFKSIEREI